jgi:hypothetical protein
VRSNVERIDTEVIDINDDVMNRYRNITLAGDIMFINKIPFFVTISRAIKFATSEMIVYRKNPTILIAIKQVMAAYAKRGFILTTLIMDGDVEPMRSGLALIKINLNTTSNNEHVQEIEQHIGTLKERVRCVYNTLSFKVPPERLVIEMVYYATFWLNSFQSYDGISQKDSARTIVTELRIDYTKHCQIEFGSYVQTHEEHDITISTRTTGDLALRPTGNSQGGYYFYSLITGRTLNRNKWTVLPMPGEVMDRIRTLSSKGRGGVNGIVTMGRDGAHDIGVPESPNEDEDNDDESWRPVPDDGSDDDDPPEDDVSQENEMDDEDPDEDVTSIQQNNDDHSINSEATQILDNSADIDVRDVEERVLPDAMDKENNPGNTDPTDTASDMDLCYVVDKYSAS